MVEQAGQLASATQQHVVLELSVSPLDHLLAERCPWIRADREDDKDLEGMEASKRGLVRITGGKKGGQLNEAATLELGIVQCG